MSNQESVGKKKGFISTIERAGNALPDPVTLFLIIGGIILICSAVFGGVTVINPASGDPIVVNNLLTRSNIVRILINLPVNMVNFAPLANVLIILFGIGLCEYVGLLKALINKLASATPKKLIVPTIAFIGIMANMVGDAGIIILAPLAGMLFLALGRNPITGIILSYASVAAGFTANLIINTTDVVILGFTQQAADGMNAGWQGNPAFNMYFIMFSTILLIPVATFVNNKLVEPRLGKYVPEEGTDLGDITVSMELSSDEKRGLKWTGIAAIILLVLFTALCVPANSIFRNQDNGSLIINSPLLFSLSPVLGFIFLIIGMAYGYGAKKLKNNKDVVAGIVSSLSNMRYFLVFSFAAGNMMTWFNWSNLGQVVAVNGANWLQSVGLTGLPLLFSFIILCTLINLLISSNAAKWGLLAPVFVPMLLLMGFDPAAASLAYRIGDSLTNPITPMMSTLAIVLIFVKAYDKKAGVGTLIANALPYSLCFAAAWAVQLIVWYVLNLPIGPGFFFHF